MDISAQRYLEAKKRVNDRGLNERVWQGLKSALIGAGGREGVRILDVGGGLGTLLPRLLAEGVLSRAVYTLLCGDAEEIHATATRLPQALRGVGLHTDSRSGGLFVYSSAAAIDVGLEAVSLIHFIEREAGEAQWDVIVGQGALNGMDVPALLPELCSLAYPGALLYFAANLAGPPLFEPTFNAASDEIGEAGGAAGERYPGRGLFTWLREAGLEIVDAGPSGGAVFPRRGCYSGDEAYFLHGLIEKNRARGENGQEGEALVEWAAVRHAQVERAVLSVVMPQVDFLIQVSA